MTLRGMLLAGALGAIVSLAGAGAAQAHNTCLDRIHREEHKLDRDIHRHGLFSRQAQHRREKVLRLRQRCGGFFGFDRRRGPHRRWDRDRWDDWDGRGWHRYHRGQRRWR